MKVTRDDITQAIMRRETPEVTDKRFQAYLFGNTEEIAENFSSDSSDTRDKLDRLSFAEIDTLVGKYRLRTSDENIAKHLNVGVEMIPMIINSAIERLATDDSLYEDRTLIVRKALDNNKQ